MDKFDPIWVLGCMSGTSMDGVDVAVIRTDGIDVQEFGPSNSHSFSDQDRATIAAAVGLWPADDARILAAAAAVVHDRHVDAIAPLADLIELVGFHGQTVNHDPAGGRTHQLGDGAQLATRTGIKTVWDFRSKDMTLGGQGAPLAPFYHFACAKHLGATEPVAFLNLGGVGNVTYVDPTVPSPDFLGALLAFDTGPASAMIDDFVAARTGAAFDSNGELAAAGQVNSDIVEQFLQHDYFAKKPPKSLDRNDFVGLLTRVADMSDADGAATLTAATVASVARSSDWLPTKPTRWLVTGGGRKNQSIMQGLQAALGVSVVPVEHVGLDGDLLEAQAFAYLAVRHLRGLATAAPGTTGCRVPNSGGRVDVP